MISYLNVFGGATPIAPQTSDLNSKNVHQNLEIDFEDDFMLGELKDFDSDDDLDFVMAVDDKTNMEETSTQKYYWFKTCKRLKRTLKRFEYYAKKNGAKTNSEVAEWCR